MICLGSVAGWHYSPALTNFSFSFQAFVFFNQKALKFFPPGTGD